MSELRSALALFGDDRQFLGTDSAGDNLRESLGFSLSSLGNERACERSAKHPRGVRQQGDDLRGNHYFPLLSLDKERACERSATNPVAQEKDAL